MPIKITNFRGAILKGDLSAIPDDHASSTTLLTKNATLQPVKKPTETIIDAKTNTQTIVLFQGVPRERVISQTIAAGTAVEPATEVGFTVIMPV